MSRRIARVRDGIREGSEVGRQEDGLRSLVTRAALMALAAAMMACTGSTPSPVHSVVSSSPSDTPTAAPVVPPGSSVPSPSQLTSVTVQPGELWVVYQWIDGQGDGIYLIRPDGTGLHQVVPELPGSESHPDWSPDGQRIAFIHLTPADRTELWVVDAGSGDAAKVASCDLPCNEWNYPDWSPDGTAIFVGTSSHAENGPPTTFGVDRVDPLTGKVKTVLERTDGKTAEQPRVSPDGSLIAYMRAEDIEDASRGSAIYVADLAGGPEHRLTDPVANGGHPDWTLDGRIVFDTFDLNFFQDTDESSNAYAIDADGSGLTALTHRPSRDRVTQPRVTPDGTGIAYTRVTGPGWGERRLAMMSLDGTGDRWLVDPPVSGTHGQLRPQS